jgi:hypothetical protein
MILLLLFVLPLKSGRMSQVASTGHRRAADLGLPALLFEKIRIPQRLSESDLQVSGR